MNDRKQPSAKCVARLSNNDNSPHNGHRDGDLQKKLVVFRFHIYWALRVAIAVYGFNFGPV